MDEVPIIEEKKEKMPDIEEKTGEKGVEEMVTKTKKVTNIELDKKVAEKKKEVPIIEEKTRKVPIIEEMKKGDKVPQTKKIARVERKWIANLGPRGQRKLPASNKIRNPSGGNYLRMDSGEASLASEQKELTTHNYYKLVVADVNKPRKVLEGCINPFMQGTPFGEKNPLPRYYPIMNSAVLGCLEISFCNIFTSSNLIGYILLRQVACYKCRRGVLRI